MAFNQSKPNLPHMVSSLVGISGGSLQELGKAKSMLEAYVNGTRKTRPPQKVLDLLEKHQIITKKSGSGRMPRKPPPKLAVEHPEAFEGGKVNRLKKAKKWTSFVKDDIIKDGIDLTAYGYDKYSAATNPYGHAMAEAITGGKVNRLKKAKKWTSFVKDDIVKDGIDLAAYGYDKYSAATNPYGHAMSKALTGGARPPSKWILFVKEYANKHNLKYADALKKAGPEYRKLTGSGYNKVGAGYNNSS